MPFHRRGVGLRHRWRLRHTEARQEAAAGLSGAVDSTSVVMTAGLAGVAAGAIAMGLGGYLAARTDAEHYRSEWNRELRETQELPDVELKEVRDILVSHGVTEAQADGVARTLAKDRPRWVRFMMQFELGLEEPEPSRAPRNALTIGGAYIVGGLIPRHRISSPPRSRRRCRFPLP